MEQFETTASSNEKHPLTSLYLLLDTAALDAEAWKRGYEAYQKSIDNGYETDQAYWDALDACAENEDLWNAGWATIDSQEDGSEEELLNKNEKRFQLSAAKYEAISSYHDKSEDYIIADVTNGVFGVFDGMGGNGGDPAAAAQAAGQTVLRILADNNPVDIHHLTALLKHSFNMAREAVMVSGKGGSTVATAVKLCAIDGQPMMGIAHAGDTRLFKYTKRSNIFQALTTDQSNGNSVYNGFSGNRRAEHDEYGIHPIEIGDRIMICSDGITGDYEEQFLSEAEYLKAFNEITPVECAAMFYTLSKKDDDKSVIVVDIK